MKQEHLVIAECTMTTQALQLTRFAVHLHLHLQVRRVVTQVAVVACCAMFQIGLRSRQCGNVERRAFGQSGVQGCDQADVTLEQTAGRLRSFLQRRIHLDVLHKRQVVGTIRRTPGFNRLERLLHQLQETTQKRIFNKVHLKQATKRSVLLPKKGTKRIGIN